MKLLLTTIVLASCSSLGWYVYQDSLEHSTVPEEKKAKRPLTVEVTHLQHKKVEDRTDLVGSLEAVSIVEIRSRVSGYITKLPFDVGDRVETGQTVIELDSSKNQELVASSAAALKVAKAQLKAKNKSLELIQKTVTRQIELEKSGVATAQQLEASNNQLAVTQAEIELEQARVDQAESDLLQSRLALKESTVTAPLSGFVATRTVEVGDLAKPDETMFSLVDLGKVKTVVHIIEKDYEKVKLDQLASISVDAFPGQAFEGKVVRIAPVLNPETRTAAVHIEIPNKEILLKPGMHARVSIVFQKKENARVLPVAALVNELTEKMKSQVYVITGNPPQTALTDVVTGIRDDDMIEIVSGLGPKDRVVALGNRIVAEGQQVSFTDVDEIVNDDLSSAALSDTSNIANTGE